MNDKQIRKWDESATSEIILQKIYGMPFNRLARLQSVHEVPIAPSTLWQQVQNVWDICGKAIYEELLELGLNGYDFHLMIRELKFFP